jgi:hypothetical protein
MGGGFQIRCPHDPLETGENAPLVPEGTGSAHAAPHENQSALVIGYGRIVEPPYVFEGAGAIRMLNGLQYYPQPFSALARDSVVVSDEMRERSAKREALRTSIREQTKNIPDIGVRLQAMRELFEESVLVEHVNLNVSSLEVKWVDFAVLETIDANPRVGTRSAEEPYDEFGTQDSIVNLFWSTIGRGNVVAFGDDYIVFGGDPEDGPQVRTIVCDLREGKPIARSDIKGTPLEDSRIIKSVLHAANRDQSTIVDE